MLDNEQCLLHIGHTLYSYMYTYNVCIKRMHTAMHLDLHVYLLLSTVSTLRKNVPYILHIQCTCLQACTTYNGCIIPETMNLER